MPKLTGKAKKAFLAKMAAGRRRAARRRGSTRKKGRRKKNPELMTIVNPAKAGLARAVRNYRKFHGQDPPAIWRLKRGGKGKPLVLIALGRAIEIVYEPVTGQRKRIQWFHEFGKDAVLAVSEDRKQLYILTPAGKVLFDFSQGITG